MLWRKAFMEEGTLIFFVKALFKKLCMVGGREWERDRALSEMREEGKEKNTQRIKDSSIIWDELNMSVIPKSKL